MAWKSRDDKIRKFSKFWMVMKSIIFLKKISDEGQGQEEAKESI